MAVNDQVKEKMMEPRITAKDGGVMYLSLADLVSMTGVGVPPDWDRSIREAVEVYGEHVKKKGRGPGSLEGEESAGLDYIVLAGQGVRQHLPWLWELYSAYPVITVMSSLAGEPVKTADGETPSSCINVNLVVGQGGRYEWHTDAHPYTCLLYCTSHGEGEGGELAWLPEGQEATEENIEKAGKVQPAKGLMVMMDGAAHPHAVLPLTEKNAVRVSVPMQYLPVHGYEVNRDAGLDNYLFSGKDEKENKDEEKLENENSGEEKE